MPNKTNAARFGIAPPMVDCSGGFTPDNDLFRYRPLAEGLSSLVAHAAGSLVLLLDGSWGTGKTTFAKQWAEDLRASKHPVVFFDAFAHDAEVDGFYPLAGKVLEHCREPEVAHSADEFLKAALILANILALAQGQPPPFGSPLNALVPARPRPRLLRARITAASKRQQAIGDFRNALRALSKRLSGAEDGEDAPRKLVFIIDELDRCRPSFALNILERMKHVFDVEEVCFVLVTDLAALEQMVTKAYGIADPRRYLKKFFHVRIDLSSAAGLDPKDQRNQYLARMCEVRNIGLREPAEGPGRIEPAALQSLANVHEVSLRDIEEITLYAHLGEVAMRNRWARGTITAGLLFMKVLDPDCFRAARLGRLMYGQARDFLRFDEWTEVSNEGRRKARWLWRWATEEEPEGGESVDEQRYRQELHDSLGAHDLDTPSTALMHVCRFLDAVSV